MLNRCLAALVVLCAVSFPAEAAPKALVNAIVHVESGGNPNARGRHGEVGLMQIKLQTARSVGFRGTRKQLFHPATNVRYGTAYLDLALKRAKGNLCRAASLFNMGIFARPRCTAYGRKVIAVMRR